MARCFREIPISHIDIGKMIENKNMTDLNNARGKAAKGKDLKFDYLYFTADMSLFKEQKDIDLARESRKSLLELFQGGINAKKAGNYLQDMLEGRIDIKRKLGSLMKTDNEDHDVVSVIADETTTSDELVNNIIAMSAIISAIESEQDLITNGRITPEQVAEKNKGKGGAVTETTSMDRLLTSLGQEMLEARGVFLSGGKMYNAVAFRAYAENHLKQMEKKGLIAINENGKYISGRAKDTDSRSLSKLRPGTTLSINEEVVTDTKELSKMLKQAKRLISPYQELIPKGEQSPINNKNQKLDYGVEKVMNKVLQSAEFSINQDIKGVLDALHRLYTDSSSDESFLRTLKEKYPGKKNEDFLTKTLGIRLHNHSIYADSNTGATTASVSSLVGLMQHYDTMPTEKFFLTYFMASNVRLFQNETVINVQSGKRFDRQMTQASEAIEYEGAEIAEFVNRLAVDSGLHRDVITGYAFEEGNTSEYKPDDTLRSIMKTAVEVRRLSNIENRSKAEQEEFEGVSLSLLMKISTESENGYFSPGVIHPMEQMKFLTAAVDVQSGSDGKMKSKHLSESDATASGPLLALLQNLHVPAVREIIERIGMEGSSVESELADVYAVISEQIDMEMAESKKAMETNPDITSNQDKAESLRIISVFKKLMKKHGIGSTRDLVKMPVTKYFYEQTDKNNARAIGDDYARLLIEGGSQDVNQAIKEFGIDMEPVKPFRTNTLESEREIASKLSDFLTEHVGKYVVEKVSKSFGDLLADSKKDLTQVHSQLADLPPAVNKKGNPIDGGISAKIMSPAHYFMWMQNNKDKDGNVKEFVYEENLDFRKTLDKIFETVIKDNSGNDIFTSASHTNANSVHVLPIHMMDAAILISTMNKAYDQMKAKYGEDYKDAEIENIISKTPIQIVHDSITVPPKYSKFYEENYENEIMALTREYNVLDMTLKEYNFRLKNAMDNGYKPTEKELNTIKAIQERSDKNFQETKDYIDSKMIEDENTGESRLAVIAGSFKTDISDLKTAKSDANAVKRNNEYSGSKKAKNETTEDATETVVDEGYLPQEVKDNAETIAKIFESGNYAILDTETTGKENGSVVHEIAYTIDGTTVTINLPVSKENMNKATAEFLAFYIKTHGLSPKQYDGEFENNNEQEKLDRSAVAQHIANKALEATELRKMLDQMEFDLAGKDVFAHNAQFDVKRMEDSGLGNHIISARFHDTLDLARTVFEDKLAASGEHYKYVKGVVGQQDLVDVMPEVEADGAHTADGDNRTLNKIVEGLVNRLRNKPIPEKEIGEKEAAALKELTSIVTKDGEIRPVFKKLFKSFGIEC